MTDTLSVDAPYQLYQSTIDAARRHIWRRASAEAWTDQALDDMLAMLGLDEAPAPEVVAPEPEPVVEPAPEPEPYDPWFTMPDVLDETGAQRHYIDRWIESGHIAYTALRQPAGTVVPARLGVNNSGNRRLWTRGDIARACRMQHLFATWRKAREWSITTADCAAIARMGHLQDIDPVLARTVQWDRIATAARDAALAEPDLPIRREALGELAVRAANIAIELGGAHVDTTPERP